MKTDLVVEGLIFHEEKVLITHHKKLDKWFPPGGHIEKDETPDECLKREIKEELNIDIELLDISDIKKKGSTKRNLATPFYVNVHNVGDHDHCCFFYIANAENISTLKINPEIKDIKWMSLKEVLESNFIPEDVKEIVKAAFERFNSCSYKT